MTLFLTNSPCVEGEAVLNPADGFLETLRQNLPRESRCLFFRSGPQVHGFGDRYGEEIQAIFEHWGLPFFPVCGRGNSAHIFRGSCRDWACPGLRSYPIISR